MVTGQAAEAGTYAKGQAPSSVCAEGVYHVFDNGHRAIESTDLVVDAGTFCTLLGPSGSGKTTLLRIVAGLLDPSGGRIAIGGQDVTDLPVQKRGIGFVFQHYALFPHFSVRQNIAYPLRIRGTSRDQRDAKVEEILRLIDLEGYGDRRPDQLSGGQQQRVAIGRALVYNPKVLLLDEPLGALDRKLRQQLGADLRRIQQETHTTAIYVTHDQDEAFQLSDKIVVMDHGVIKQEGRPEELYARPTDLFVAGFLGDTNVLAGTVLAVNDDGVLLDVDGRQVQCTPPVGGTASDSRTTSGAQATCTLRPERVRVGEATPAGAFQFGSGVVADRVFLGDRTRLTVDVAGHTMTVDAVRDELAPRAGTEVEVYWETGAPVLVRES